MNDETPSKPRDPASEMLWGFWYPALRSEQLRGKKLERAMLLEVPLVLGRDAAGKPFALRDVCPHRAFPLSFGQFDGASVECAYHGWQFDAHTGQCRHIPSLTADSKLRCERISAGSFPCEERDGYIWAFMTNPEGRPSSPRAQRLLRSRLNCRRLALISKSRASRLICRAAWTMASSASWTRRTGRSCIRRGGGAAGAASATRPSSSNRFPTVSA